MPAASHHRALVALAEAWPFCAPEAFETALVRLATASINTGGMGKLAAGFEARARVLARGHSLATIESVRDRAWFEHDRSMPHMHELLLELARAHLRWDGNAIRLAWCAANERHDQTMRWRWLSLLLPQDLLIAALAAAHRVEPCSDRVRLVGHGLAPLLEQPVAETHLHMGAALDFGELWIAILHQTTHSQISATTTAGPRPFTDPHRYLCVLVAAGLVRQLLASYLWHIEQSKCDVNRSFRAWLDDGIPRIASRIGSGARAEHVERALWTAVSELHSGVHAHDRAALSHMFRAHRSLWGGHTRSPVSASDLLDSDPLASWLPRQPGLARPETRFIKRALLHLTRTDARDEWFARCFWQYQRVRNIVFGYLVEAPGTAGLGWFKRHYDRLSAHRGCLDGHEVGSALRLHSHDITLASLEVRTAPAERWVHVRDMVRAVAEQAAAFEPAVGKPQPEVALVLHFIKQRETSAPDEFCCRHGEWFRKATRQAHAVARALRLQPELLLILRGLDVASEELAVPNWALRPLFRIVERSSREAAAELGRTHPSWELCPLRTTLHVGEDFRRLVEGLRRVHEAVEFGLLGEGDRIGHGLALGWSPRTWVAQNPVSVQPREDRLFDLLWEYERYRRRDIGGNAGRLVYLEGQLDELSKSMFGKPQRVQDLLQLRVALFDERLLVHQLGYPSASHVHMRQRTPVQGYDGATLELLTRYLIHDSVRRRAREPIEICTDGDELEVLDRLQPWLRGQLAQLGVTVEINPSSNLIIGGFADLREHPTFALAPFESLDDGGRAPLAHLPVSVNSDDPITFASALADEYAYMEAALVGQGVSSRDALQWLERAREAGWRSRFSVRASSDHDCIETLLPARRRRSQQSPR